jgi:quercetin dioxygenase-like cupin family protein
MGQLRGTRPDLTPDVEALDTVLMPLLADLPEVAPPDDLLASIEARIDDEATAAVRTVSADEGTWEQMDEKIWVKCIAKEASSGRTMHLIRCLPGAVLKGHAHKREEHVFLLEGEFVMDGVLHRAGDAQIAQAGTVHPDVHVPNGCLLLVSA